MNEEESKSDKNPFRKAEYFKSQIDSLELMEFPFKTLNRILDDLRWTIPIKEKYNYSLLNNKPIDYSNYLSNHNYEIDTLILNNQLNYCRSVEKFEKEESKQIVYILRGLIIDKHINHFRIIVAENHTNPFITNLIDKNQYHIVPRDKISPNDLNALLIHDEGIVIDDAYYKSLNSPTNQTLRVTVFGQEFSTQELHNLIDEDAIRKRYLSGIERHTTLSPETIPKPSDCITSLIKVLKGPVLLQPDEPGKTINLHNMIMDTQLDFQLLIDKLGFTLREEELCPPNLVENLGLKESYIRKVLELIYFGTTIPKSEYSTMYTFSENMSQVFSTIAEYDKNQSITNYLNVTKYPAFINLSCCTYFPDDLIIKCFENTVKSDSINVIFYVDSLRLIRNYKNQAYKIDSYLRNHPELIGYEEYCQAIKALGLSVENVNEIDDEVIIAMYRNQFKQDPRNYQYYNNQLRKISKVRMSDFLTNFIETELKPINLALNEIGIEEITEDDVVITAYEFKLDDILQANGFNPNSNEIVSLNKSLLSVGVFRRSYLLLDYLEVKLPEYYKLPQFNEITTSKAYELLDSSPDTSIFEIIQSFQNKYMIQDDVRVLRYAMKLIGEDKKSEIIVSFLKSGKIDSSLLPSENWPTGLDNIGNTCYLNSLLQYYFCIKPLRELVLNFQPNKQNEITDRKIGGRKVDIQELQRSYQFIYQLKKLFEEMIQSDKRCVQPSKELAYLSFLPLSQPVEFKKQSEKEVIVIDDEDVMVEEKEIAVDDNEETKNVHNEDIVEVKEDVDIIEDENNTKDEDKLGDEVIPVLSISPDQMESTIEVGRQQDVTECIENVTYQIETALPPQSIDKDGEQIDLIKQLFYGKIKQTIKINSEERISIERFFSLIINISEHPKSIYDALDYYFNEDSVTLDEGTAQKTMTILETPQILQFHVQRVMFDREKLMAYKSIEPIPFSEKIYLDRYLDTTDEEILSKRKQAFKWKQEMSQLNEQRDEITKIDPDTKISIIDNLKITMKYLQDRIVSDEKLSIELDTIQTIQQEIDNLTQGLKDIDAKLQNLQDSINVQFQNYTKVCYSIFAIFIHRGEASYGHYWVYIKDPHYKNTFRKYNDELVTEVADTEVFNFLETNTATPYYIVYVKEELESNYIEPLKREIR